MPTCSNCGREIGQGNFCPYCGAPAGAGATPTGASPPAPPGVAAGATQAPAYPSRPPQQQPQATPPQPQAQYPQPPGAPGYRAGAYAPSAPAAKPRGRLVKAATVWGAIGLGGMAIAAVGSALPWATAGAFGYSTTKYGLSGDGIITIIFALAGLGFFAAGAAVRARWALILGLVMSVIVLAVGIVDVIDVAGTSMVSVGFGLVMVVIGGVIGLLAGVVGAAMKKE